MLRVIAAQDLCAIFKRSSATSRLAMGQVNHRCLPQSRLFLQKVNFFTKSPYRSDVPLPNPRESSDVSPDTIDLDKWKAVMRSKAIPKENPQVGDKDENEEEAEGISKLEATRKVVAMWARIRRRVPQEISDEQLQTFASLTTRCGREAYLNYLCVREQKKRLAKEKQLKRQAEREAFLEQIGEAEGDEGADQKVMENLLFLKYWQQSLDKLNAWRCAQAMMFGQPLVFDLSYEGDMTKREIENTVTQLIDVEAWNRRATEPYHLHYCNLQPDSYFKERLVKRYQNDAYDRLLITSTDKQYFDLFPRKQLVYLSPDSPNVLRAYDHNKVYIIGGLVDRSGQMALSLANAKRFKLATARLPLDEFLNWEMGAKTLTLDQMIRILLTLKETGNWEEALRFVPPRKHRGFHTHQQKQTKMVMGEKTFKSGNISLEDLKLNNTNTRPSFNRPKTVKTKTEKMETNQKNVLWWNEE